MKKLFVVYIVLLLLGSCLIDDPLKMPFQTYTPSNIGDGWIISDPASENIDGEALKDVYRYVHDENNVWQIRSLLVFRNGKLVAESYMKDKEDRTNPRAIWECTNQVLAVLTGIAADQNLLSLTDTISDHLSCVSSAQYADKSQITIEHLLTMKSGIDYDTEGDDDEPLLNQKPSNSLDYVLGFGMQAEPGSMYRYKFADPHIISAILQEKIGKTTGDWAREVLFDKIGISALKWFAYKDGITMGGWGIATTPREMGKIAQLVLNNGMWEGEQIISSFWINNMTSIKVPNVEGGIMPDLAMGYLWWIDSSSRDIFFMRGHGGQFVFINKSKNLVVIIMSETADAGLSFNQGLSIYDQINGITN